MELGHWAYPGDFEITDWFGFIYRVVDNSNGMHYIGKKQFWSITRKVVKGKKNRKIVKAESNWKKYTSSSEHLNKAIVEKGMEQFTFLIESLHATKASMHYAEVESQINEDVLRAKLTNGDRKYYNKMVANMRFLPPVETSAETAHKIAAISKTKSQNVDNKFFNTMLVEDKLGWRTKYYIV